MTVSRENPPVHVTSFQRNTRTGMWRAMCSCGWCRVGAEVEVQSLAASHDIEWVDDKPAPAPDAFWTGPQ